MDDFLVKPFDDRQMAATLGRWLVPHGVIAAGRHRRGNRGAARADEALVGYRHRHRRDRRAAQARPQSRLVAPRPRGLALCRDRAAAGRDDPRELRRRRCRRPVARGAQPEIERRRARRRAAFAALRARSRRSPAIPAPIGERALVASLEVDLTPRSTGCNRCWERHMPPPTRRSIRWRRSAGDPQWTSPTILIVDDDPVFRSLTRDALEDAGLRVVEAADGVEACRRCAEAMPALLIVRRDDAQDGRVRAVPGIAPPRRRRGTSRS